MRRSVFALMAALAAALLFVAPVHAQNLSLRGPAWAQPLLATDVIATTGGRASLNEPGIDVAARITIAPTSGGVARVVRYEQRGDDAKLALRRFTGHPSTGWWLWGGDAPLATTPAAAVRQELAGLVRAAMGAGSLSAGSDTGATCPRGEQAYIEVALGGRSTSATRTCVGAQDALGRLALRLSELGGSRTEEALAAAAVEEVLAVDRAFNAMAQADGAPAAFAHYAAGDAVVFHGEEAKRGAEGVAAVFADWPAGTTLTWAPEMARVSARGDMAWTWGRASYTPPGGEAQARRYVTIWTRDWQGDWKFAFDAALK